MKFSLCYVRDLLCVMCVIWSVLCAGLRLCCVPDIICVTYVRDSVCVTCGVQFVMCAGFSLCGVNDLVCVMCSAN